MTRSSALLDQILRRDLVAFLHRVFQTVLPGEIYLPAWYVEVIADRLEQVRLGTIKRLIICLPPRYLKSLCTSVAFPAWVLGHDPSHRLLCVSYAQDLATKHARDCRAVLESPWYRRVFPHTRLAPTKCSEAELTTTERGFRLTTSVGGTLTGRGGNLLIIDDPLKAQDAYSEAKRSAANEWFRTTAFSRLDNKQDDAIVIVTQRLHVDDLVGHLLQEDPQGWTVLRLPAIADGHEQHRLLDGTVVERQPGEPLHPEREGLLSLERTQRQLGAAAFAAQYQQEPLPEEGGLIQWGWFKTYLAPPVKQPGDELVISWDTASKAEELHDWSVGTVWLRHGQDHHLLEVIRVRLDYPSLRRRILTEAERWQADAVLIEDKGSGTPLLQDLRAQLHPIGIVPVGDKVVRFHAQSLKIEQGMVWLPERAPWLDEFKAEVLAFPHGRYDDQIDSVAQYLGWADKRGTTSSGSIGVVQSRLLTDPLSPWYGHQNRGGWWR